MNIRRCLSQPCRLWILLFFWTLGLSTFSLLRATAWADDCALITNGVGPVGGECVVSTAQTLQGVFNISETVRITATGSLTVPPIAGGNFLALNISGDFIIETPSSPTVGSRIVGNVTSTSGIGAAIQINATGDIHLKGNGGTLGGRITADQVASSCSGGSAGQISLKAGQNVIAEKGALISANGPCAAGPIEILASRDTTIAGSVLSQSTLTGTGAIQSPGGGPITIQSGCSLKVDDSGIVSSKGKDPGADLVHLAGGCAVEIFGLVESTGPGHVLPNAPTNHCNLNGQTTTPATACVEVWSGGPLTISNVGAHNGQVNLDTAQSGGHMIAWGEFYAVEDIAILGSNAAPYVIHANATVTNADGGVINVGSLNGKVITSLLAIQANATASGGRGGHITINAGGAGAAGDVGLGSSTNQAIGATTGTGQAGGQFFARSFKGSVIGISPGLLNVSGGPSPGDGLAQLTACTAVVYTGTVTPASAKQVVAPQCADSFQLPPYVVLPGCVCRLNPHLSVTKSCVAVKTSATSYKVTFNGEVCNDGGVDVTITKMTDNQPVPNTVISLNQLNDPDKVLTPLQCASYTDSFFTSQASSSDTVTVEGLGALNTGTVSASAQATCAADAPRCGDGQVNQTTEQCDDGNTNNNDGCSSTCKLEKCGDGVKQTNEQCDDGNTTSGDGCSSTCKLELCGDGVKQGAEQCDDGNTNNNDGCSSTCKIEKCGDGIKQTKEQCDDGNTVDNDGCSNYCKLPKCGDRIVQTGEQCDDGNTYSGDGCSSTCQTERCGDGVKQGYEQCDDGNTVDNDGCTNRCKLPKCGDRIIQTGEQCDDGNTYSGDGCSSTCKLEICGDGIKQGTEQCDDGDSDDHDYCRNNCKYNVCGDGSIKTGYEECDDGNKTSGDGCSSTCKLEKQGCTIGFWKQDQHFSDWTNPYDPTDKLGSVFTFPSCLAGCWEKFPYATLLTGLQYQGGSTLCQKAETLIRQAVGAVLNAANPNITYPIEPASSVISQVNTALASCSGTTYINTATQLDGYNNLHNCQVCQ